MITVVIPTIGRRSLHRVLAALGADVETIVVDDRPRFCPALKVPGHVQVLRTGGRGPATARNAGWRAARTPWIAFLDDDVVPQPGWQDALIADLADLPDDVAGSQGRLRVELPVGRRPTDAEWNTVALTKAGWATADMAYRRSALESIGGFDERFPHAYREDADIALRLLKAGFELAKGQRVTLHPVRDDGFWSSVRAQRGNADDALMRRVHGAGWRAAVDGVPGRLSRHAVTTALGLVSCALLVAVGRGGHQARYLPALGAMAGLGWLALTAEFAWARLAPGPRTPEEVLRMTVTSVIIPPVACAHRLRGELRVRR
ncbi:glycosyltransferase family 2 protein [Sphaerisporangium perillae]|uniref:glycosyltransferase family 2 protein n=1 Tax=Sphaerisporangium perillae TaxID=2935860 RepID=UPI00200CA1E2|nr:glycosyltransferase [Sphaerisporangium perillae]